MTAAERASLREPLRTPAIVFAGLLLLLCGISAIGVITPYGHWWIAEAVMAVMMVSIVIVFSMEMFRHQPIVRLFSLLGFFWVGILFSMTMVDYLTR